VKGNPGIIEIHHLSKYYHRSKGIEDISLEVKEGDIFGFIGPNGAGKSTTIRILLNLIFPTSGNASILGLDVIRDSRKIRRRIGYVPSDANLYDSMNVYEFLKYCADFHGVSSSRDRIRELTEFFDLDMKRSIQDLSLGNKKKVTLIQSLVHKPELLIMDEPTTGLDPLMQSRVFDLLRIEQKRGMTIFFSSHVLSEVQAFCKTVAIVRDGKIVNVEDIESLRKKQLKKIRVEFDTVASVEGLGLDGIQSVDMDNSRELIFMYSGEPGSLIRNLSGRNILNLTVEEPPLEEIFLHYYNQPQQSRHEQDTLS
jgi:ABC-2 type transport system ATP-binding protein